MPDAGDDNTLIARLLDENQQLKEELAALREDYEHALRVLGGALREEQLG